MSRVFSELATTAEAAASFYVVITTKGKIDFTKDAITERELQGYGFNVGAAEANGHHGLFRAGNRVALLFPNKTVMSDYLQSLGCNSEGFSSGLLGWWFA
jgi:hypothetical protein